MRKGRLRLTGLANEMTDKIPQVSVVVIFHNAERFLLSALESVRAQTFDSWELLLVDDGSTDASSAIARLFLDCCPQRTILLHHPGHYRRGMSASRNLGARTARGNYLAFLDADDVWLPKKLEQQVAMLAGQSRADAVFGRTLYWASWPGSERGPQDDLMPELGVPPGTVVTPPHLLRILYPLGRSTAPSLSNLMVRRQAYDAIGGFEEEFTGFYEDQAFLAKLYLNCAVLISGDCWDLYRKHPNSCSAIVAQAGTYHELRKRYLEWLEQYLRCQDVQDEGIDRLLTSALKRYRQPIAHRVSQTRARLMGYGFEATRRMARSLLPDRLRRAAWRRIRGLTRRPPVGFVRFGSLRRVTPISSNWGEDRGVPIDRYYIEQFLSRCAADVRGSVLEIQEDWYTRRFGGDHVKKSDVLSVAPGNPLATIIANLEDAKNIPDCSYDCIIVTQTLQLIYNYDAAIRTMHRILCPGGVALVTVPGISKIARDEVDGWSAQWHFTQQSATKAFSKIFGEENVTAEAHGNVLAAIAFLHGLAICELRGKELQHKDHDFPLIIEVRAQKPRIPQ